MVVKNKLEMAPLSFLVEQFKAYMNVSLDLSYIEDHPWKKKLMNFMNPLSIFDCVVKITQGG